MIRKLCGIDKSMLSKNTVQVALRLASNAYQNEIVSQMISRYPPLHMCTKDGNLLRSSPPKIKTIPNTVKSLEEAVLWEKENREDRLAQISLGNEIIVLQVSHSVADGASVADLISSLGCDHPSFDEPVSLTYSDLFSSQLNLTWKEEPIPSYTFFLPSKNPGKYPFLSKQIFSRVPLNTLSCFDPQKKKMQNATERFFISLFLSSYLHNKKISGKDIMPRACVNTMINMRQFVPPTIPQMNIGSIFSSLNLSAPPILPETKLGDISFQIRSNLNDKIRRGLHYKMLPFFVFGHGSDPPGKIEKINAALSSLGIIKTHHPIVDALIGNDHQGNWIMSTVLFAPYSINNEFRSIFVYNCNALSDVDANMIVRNIIYSLKYCNFNQSFKEAAECIESLP